MINGKTILGIIPARYGSKRLKLKNLRIFKGKPLVVWSYLIAKKSKYIDKIIISSESKKILNLVKKYGYKEKYIRNKLLSRDNSKSEHVILDVIKKNKSFNYFIFLQPTSPLRKTYDIDKAIATIIKKKKDVLVSTIGNSKILNGAIYIHKLKKFLKVKNFKSKRKIYFQMAKKRSIDIDYLDDFKKAERLF